MSLDLAQATDENAAPIALASDTDDAPRKRKYVRKATPPPRPLTLLCERCDRPIRGSGAGFAYVDLRDAQAAMTGRADGGKARWTVAHQRCAPAVTATINPYFRLWAERIATVDELLDAVAELSRQPWFAATDWGGLVRRVLADTDAEQTTRQMHAQAAAAVERRERIKRQAGEARERRYAEGLSDDDPRHGTTGYGHYGCRCERCVEANTEASRARGERRKAKRALSGTHSDEHGMGASDGH
jgi:hypothetical protein